VFTGRVVARDGAEIEGARIVRDGVRGLTARSSEDGSFELPIEWESARQFRTVALRACHPDLPGHLGLLHQRFEADDEPSGIITLERRAKLRGRVVDQDGVPVTGLTVYLEAATCDGGFRKLGERVTRGTAGFMFADALAGKTHRLTARLRPNGAIKAQQVLDVGEDSVTAPDMVVTVARRTVTGIVTAFDGRPIPNVHVVCMDVADSRQYALSDDQGRFALTGLQQGPLTFRASVSGPDGHSIARATANVGPFQNTVRIVINGNV
jgi:hypothetical protein